MNCQCSYCEEFAETVENLMLLGAEGMIAGLWLQGKLPYQTQLKEVACEEPPTLCPECGGEPDERVQAGMKCAKCAGYTTGRTNDTI